MISTLKQINYSADAKLIEAYGLSTDSKPTTNIANGSMFVEMDSGKIYFFDAEGGDWTAFN